jgi:hypothetical protein
MIAFPVPLFGFLLPVLPQIPKPAVPAIYHKGYTYKALDTSFLPAQNKRRYVPVHIPQKENKRQFLHLPDPALPVPY